MENCPSADLHKRAKQAYTIEQYSECRRLCESVLVMTGVSREDRITSLHLLADSLLDLEEFQKAIEVYGTLLGIAPDSIAHGNRGYAFMELKQWDKALQEYGEAVRLDPNDIIAAGFFAECHIRANHADEALALLGKAITRWPAESRFYRILGDGFSAKSEWSKAWRAYRQAVKLDASDTYSQRRLTAIERLAEDNDISEPQS